MDNKLEYIPGDLVMVKESAFQFAKDKIFKVISSLSGGFVKVVMLNDSSTTYSISNNAVRPISITPKILSANSFKIFRQDESGAAYFKEGLGIDIIASYVRNCYDIYISGNRILKGIEYVHELQHLLFGLGLKQEMEV